MALIRLAPMRSAVATLAALALLSGCGNQQQERIISLDMLRGLLKRPDPIAQVTLQDIQTVLARTEAPLELAVREDETGWAFYVSIQRNGGYDTYANDIRQTMTLHRGIVTATRGLGGDLMSSDVAQTAALIAARRPGQGRRVMRYLDGADQTQEIVFACTVTVGGPASVSLGAVTASTVTMIEECRAGSRSITNTYLVDAGGRSLGSRQWLGDFSGYVLFQTLRR